LPGHQQELVDALAATGKPIVCVLMSGRPLVIPKLAQQASALLVAWHGGIRAGRAVADLLFGATNPSGRLSASFPRAEGQIPVYYAHKNTGRPAEGAGTQQFDEAFKSRYLDEPNSALFPFGFGLSYTTFTYSHLTIETPSVPLGGTLVASAQIRNVGTRSGTEVVQFYVRDLVASVTRPVRELKAFERITLAPGESRTVRFELPAHHLGFVGLDMQPTVEPGDFHLWIAPDSTSGLRGTFRLTN
jgi:beta-glucosidase